MELKTLIAYTALGFFLGAPGWANAAEPAGSMQSGAQEQNSLMNMQVRQIEGKEIANLKGENLGTIQKVVLDRKDNSLHVVVSIGEYAGTGPKQKQYTTPAKLTTIPINQIQMQNDKLVWNSSDTRDQLRKQPEYQAAGYQEILHKSLSLAEAGTVASTVSFATLDANKDGFISQDEAKSDPQLAENFQKADKNSDDKIDESEFSAFEESQQSMTPSEKSPEQTQPGGGSQQ